MFKFVAGLYCDFHAGLPAEVGNLIVPYGGASKASQVSERFEILIFQNAGSIAVARGEGGVIPPASTFGKNYFPQKFLGDLRDNALVVSSRQR